MPQPSEEAVKACIEEAERLLGRPPGEWENSKFKGSRSYVVATRLAELREGLDVYKYQAEAYKGALAETESERDRLRQQNAHLRLERDRNEADDARAEDRGYHERDAEVDRLREALERERRETADADHFRRKAVDQRDRLRKEKDAVDEELSGHGRTALQAIKELHEAELELPESCDTEDYYFPYAVKGLREENQRLQHNFEVKTALCGDLGAEIARKDEALALALKWCHPSSGDGLSVESEDLREYEEDMQKLAALAPPSASEEDNDA